VLAKTLVGGVLVVAGTAKLLNRGEFSQTVRRFRILPKVLVPAFAGALPIAEILAGGSLIISIFLEWRVVAWSGALAIALFALFGAAITMSLARGITDISCGCFGKASNRKLSWGLAGRICFFLLVSVLTLPSLNQQALADRSPAASLQVMFMGLALFGLVWLFRGIKTAHSLQVDL
jgi:hypothetical protein